MGTAQRQAAEAPAQVHTLGHRTPESWALHPLPSKRKLLLSLFLGTSSSFLHLTTVM